MTDRPIIFSGAMVRALLDGRKTQTRRLATSPLRKCEPGDRLYVRENWKPHSTFAELKPRDIPPSRVFYAADDRYAPSNTPWVPSIHMPRWASRLTLVVENVRVEPLQLISEADAIAEGASEFPCEGHHRGVGATYWTMDEPTSSLLIKRTNPISAYRALWMHLHGEESWDANPDVLVLQFSVQRENIDGIATPPPPAIATI